MRGKLNIFKLLLTGICFLVTTIVGIAAYNTELLGQGFAAPSGCRTTTLKNSFEVQTGSSKILTARPEGKNVVIGAFTVTDDDIEDKGLLAESNCTPPGPADGHPTHVTAIKVKIAEGNLNPKDILAVKLFLDGNGDGLVEDGQDIELVGPQPGDCLRSECTFMITRTNPLLDVNETGHFDQSKSFLVAVDLGANAPADATLRIVATGEANDIAPRGADAPSSDFNDDYRSQLSNLELKILPQIKSALNEGTDWRPVLFWVMAVAAGIVLGVLTAPKVKPKSVFWAATYLVLSSFVLIAVLVIFFLALSPNQRFHDLPLVTTQWAIFGLTLPFLWTSLQNLRGNKTGTTPKKKKAQISGVK